MLESTGFEESSCASQKMEVLKEKLQIESAEEKWKIIEETGRDTWNESSRKSASKKHQLNQYGSICLGSSRVIICFPARGRGKKLNKSLEEVLWKWFRFKVESISKSEEGRVYERNHVINERELLACRNRENWIRMNFE